MEFKKYQISKLEDTADRIRIFFLEPLDGININFKAGQFVKIYDSDRKLFRPYSITSLPQEKYLEFAIKLESGVFTTYLAGLKVGDFVWVEGPLGHFHYDGEDLVGLIAGGVGIAPIIGIVRDIAKTRKKGDFVLFYSAKTAVDFAYFDELKKIAKENTHIKVIFTVTKENPADWDGECCRVDKVMIEKYAKNPETFKWYICGPLKMTLALKDILLELGVPKEKIKFEGWG